MLQRAQSGRLCYKEHNLEDYATKSTIWKITLQRAQSGRLCYKDGNLRYEIRQNSAEMVQFAVSVGFSLPLTVPSATRNQHLRHKICLDFRPPKFAYG